MELYMSCMYTGHVHELYVHRARTWAVRTQGMYMSCTYTGHVHELYVHRARTWAVCTQGTYISCMYTGHVHELYVQRVYTWAIHTQPTTASTSFVHKYDISSVSNSVLIIVSSRSRHLSTNTDAVTRRRWWQWWDPKHPTIDSSASWCSVLWWVTTELVIERWSQLPLGLS